MKNMVDYVRSFHEPFCAVTYLLEDGNFYVGRLPRHRHDDGGLERESEYGLRIRDAFSAGGGGVSGYEMVIFALAVIRRVETCPCMRPHAVRQAHRSVLL